MELAQVLLAEHDENELLAEFTLSERYAMYLAKRERIGNRHGQRTDKELVFPGTQVPSSDEVPAGETTAEVAAQYAGLGSRDTAYRVAKVVENGVPELVEAMDAGAGVSGFSWRAGAAYRVLQARPSRQRAGPAGAPTRVPIASPRRRAPPAGPASRVPVCGRPSAHLQ